MLHVLRNPEGQITAILREAGPGSEALPPDHPELLAFLRQDAASPGAEQTFATLDAELVRVIEDVVDVLVQRNLLRITDLPAEAQQKLFARKNFRERMQSHSLNLFGNEALGGEGGVIATDFGQS